MPMLEAQFGDQTIRYDREATSAIYASMPGGWAEGCGCVGCRNLMPQRDVIYPAPFRELLDRLGIDSNKESEAVADGPLQNGLHHYGGWFFFVGEMAGGTGGNDTIKSEIQAELRQARERVVTVSDSPYFAYFFTRFGPC